MSKLSKGIADLTPEQRMLFEQKLKEQQLGRDELLKINLRPIPQQAPLSYSQWRLWFLDQYEPGNPTFNIPVAYRLKGPIETEVLNSSLNEIIRRHEILRTVFSIVGSEPIQNIQNSYKHFISITNLENYSKDEREVIAKRLVTLEAKKPFDLSLGPLIRTNLIRLDQEDHIFILNIHHIIFDGWSLGIFFKELNLLYNSFLKGAPSPLPDLRIQYADFAVWQRSWLQGERLEKQLTYWKGQLSEAPILELPTDYSRQNTQSFQGETLNLSLSKELTNAIKNMGINENATGFMVLLAAFNILLQRYSGQNDILIGIPIAGRNKIETEELIGFFLNSLVIRTDLSKNPSFKGLLQNVRDTAIEAYDHQDLPFEKIIEEINPPRDLSRTPFFQIFFNMVNVSSTNLDLEGLKVEPFPIDGTLSKFDLTVYVRERQGIFYFNFTFNPNLFSKARIAAMLSQYRGLLEQISVDPDKLISEYSLITPETKNVLPDPTLPLSDEWFGTIHEKVSQHAIERPEHIALLDKTGPLSYKALDRISNEIADQLTSEGIQSGDIIAIYATRNSDLVTAILGIHKAKGAFLILDPAYPPSRLVDYLQVAKPKGFIYLEAAGELPKEIKDKLRDSDITCQLNLPLKTSGLQTKSTPDFSTSQTHNFTRPDDLAYIAFTSGSTGIPKGILGQHRSLSHFIPWQQSTLGLRPSDRFSMLSGLSHDPLQRDIFTSLWVGATLCIPDPDRFGDPGWLAGWMEHEKITFAHLTPAMGQYICYSVKPNTSLATIRYFFFVGDILTQNDLQRLRELAPQATFINSYGSTETQRAVATYLIPPDKAINFEKHPRGLPVGRGLPNVQLLILNDNNALTGIGELGEIYVRSPHLASGYLGDDSLTSSRFIPNPFRSDLYDRLYKTGDLGRYLPDGNVIFLGRKDNQIKIRGFRIELGEIEAALIKNPDIQEAIVLSREMNTGPNKLVAYIIPSSGKVPTPQELRNLLKMTLPDYMIPSTFIPLEVFPLTPNGKIDVSRLPSPDQGSLNLQVNYIEPRTLEEGIITGIWSKILGVERVGIQENFFDLGGHSLLAIQIIAEIETALGKTIPLATLIQSPTIEGLARSIQDQTVSSEQKSLVAIQPKGKKLPLFCVPPAASTAIRFKILSKYLGEEQPLYAFEYPGMDGKSEPICSITVMANIFTQEIQTVQAVGPYYLIGMCYGGIVAYEIAQQFLAKGEQIAFLGILDSNYAPRKKKPLAYYGHLVRHLINKVIFKREEPLVELVKRSWRGQRDENDPWQQRIRKVFASNLIARLEYTSPVYPGKITKFSTDWVIAQKATREWQKATSFGLEDHIVPGSHIRRSSDDTGMMEEPNVQVVALKLQECLQNVRQDTAQEHLGIN